MGATLNANVLSENSKPEVYYLLVTAQDLGQGIIETLATRFTEQCHNGDMYTDAAIFGK